MLDKMKYHKLILKDVIVSKDDSVPSITIKAPKYLEVNHVFRFCVDKNYKIKNYNDNIHNFATVYLKEHEGWSENFICMSIKNKEAIIYPLRKDYIVDADFINCVSGIFIHTKIEAPSIIQEVNNPVEEIKKVETIKLHKPEVADLSKRFPYTLGHTKTRLKIPILIKNKEL